MNDETGGRPCTACGADVPAGRSVCPECSTLQRAPATTGNGGSTAAPPATFAGPGAPSQAPLGFAGAVGGAATAIPPPPPAAPPRRSSRGPLVVMIVVVVALIAGGGYFLSRDGDTGTDASSRTTTTVTTGADGTDATVGTVSTTAPATAPTWTDATDPRSGLSWQLPGLQGPGLESDVGMASGGPIGVLPTTWSAGIMQGDTGPMVSVSIWGPESGATQASVDELLRFHQDMYRRSKTPYPKPLTIAGAPTTAVDATSDQSSMWEAVAAVDGSLVLVQVYAGPGEQADPKVFEEVLASFTKS